MGASGQVLLLDGAADRDQRPQRERGVNVVCEAGYPQKGGEMSKINLTFEQFMNHNYEESNDENFSIYVVKDQETALYVGMTTRNAFDRWFGWNGHFRSGTPSSTIAQIIHANKPDSLTWGIELLSDAHIKKYLSERNLNKSCRWKDKVLLAEKSLIQELRPLFNTSDAPMLTDKEVVLAHKYGDKLFDFGKAPCDYIDLELS